MIEVYNIQITEGTVTEPVILDDVKAWLQIDFNDFDTLLTGMLKGARQAIEKFISLTLVPKTITLDFETPDNGGYLYNTYYGGGGDYYSGVRKDAILRLPYTKNPTVTSVSSLDDSDAVTGQVLGTDYFLRGNSLRLLNAGRQTVTYTANPLNPVPEDLKQAIKAEVAERFQSRGENPNFKVAYDTASAGLSEVAKTYAEPYQVFYY